MLNNWRSSCVFHKKYEKMNQPPNFSTKTTVFQQCCCKKHHPATLARAKILRYLAVYTVAIKKVP